MNAVSDPRAQLRSLVNALNLAITLSVHYIAPDFPDPLLIAWLGVVAILFGLGESWWDGQHPHITGT